MLRPRAFPRRRGISFKVKRPRFKRGLLLCPQGKVGQGKAKQGREFAGDKSRAFSFFRSNVKPLYSCPKQRCKRLEKRAVAVRPMLACQKQRCACTACGVAALQRHACTGWRACAENNGCFFCVTGFMGLWGPGRGKPLAGRLNKVGGQAKRFYGAAKKRGARMGLYSGKRHRAKACFGTGRAEKLLYTQKPPIAIAGKGRLLKRKLMIAAGVPGGRALGAANMPQGGAAQAFIIVCRRCRLAGGACAPKSQSCQFFCQGQSIRRGHRRQAPPLQGLTGPFHQ